jgi:hypothetical protein
MGEEGGIRPAKLVYRRELFAGIHFLDVAHDGEEAVSVVPRVASVAAVAQPVELEEGLRIVARPLPASIVSRLPWLER